MITGLLAVKRLDRGKGRLAERLTEAQRGELTAAMFADALDLCLATTDLVAWRVVSDDDRVLERAAGAGLGTVRDEGRGLNAALDLALTTVPGGPALILPCDLPLARTEDIADLVDTGATSDVVVVPSEGDGGTNGLFLADPAGFAPRFGPGSLKAHVDAAEAAGLRCSILALRRLSLDIDTPADVEALLATPEGLGGRTRALLAHLPPF